MKLRVGQQFKLFGHRVCKITDFKETPHGRLIKWASLEGGWTGRIDEQEFLQTHKVEHAAA